MAWGGANENDYSLKVTLRVFPEEKVEEINVKEELESLRKIEQETAEVERKIEGYLREFK